MVIGTGDNVRIEYVGRLADGTVFDTSREAVAEESGLARDFPDREYAPLTVEVGEGRVVEGLERGLLGLEVGDTETITVPPGAGYGERSDDEIEAFERAAFEEALQGETPEEGMHVQTQQGGIGEIVRVDDDAVRVDFNHELAGETLEFEVEILDVEGG